MYIVMNTWIMYRVINGECLARLLNGKRGWKIIKYNTQNI